MTTYTLDLIACVTGLSLWIFVFVFFSIRIALLKKQHEAEAKLSGKTKELPKVTAGYVTSVVLSLVLAVLPYLVLFQLYITIVLEGCAVLGLFMLMKDRLQTLTADPLDKA